MSDETLKERLQCASDPQSEYSAGGTSVAEKWAAMFMAAAIEGAGTPASKAKYAVDCVEALMTELMARGY